MGSRKMSKAAALAAIHQQQRDLLCCPEDYWRPEQTGEQVLFREGDNLPYLTYRPASPLRSFGCHNLRTDMILTVFLDNSWELQIKEAKSLYAFLTIAGRDKPPSVYAAAMMKKQFDEGKPLS